MPHTLSIMEARKQLTSLPETLFNNGQLDVLEITRRGKPVLAVLPWELYEAVSETLEVMADKELMAQLRQSIQDIDPGKLISWQDANRSLACEVANSVDANSIEEAFQIEIVKRVKLFLNKCSIWVDVGQ